jgi:hypothetical protein
MRLPCTVFVVLYFACAESLPAPHQEELVRREEPPAPSRKSDLKALPTEVKKLVVKVSKFQNQNRLLLKQRLGIILNCCNPWPQSEINHLVSSELTRTLWREREISQTGLAVKFEVLIC